MGWGKLLNWFKRGAKAATKSAATRSLPTPSSVDLANLSARVAPRVPDWTGLHIPKPLTPDDPAYWTRLRQEVKAAEIREAELAQEEARRRGRSNDDEMTLKRPSSPSAERLAEPVDRWIAEGYFKLVPSSNVYAIKYDAQSFSLYVQFHHWDPSMARDELSGEPGPIYEYQGVSLAEARSCYLAASKGEWVWDNLRVRGSYALHQKPYKLVAISQGYLPRKAVYDYKGSGQEWFVRRQMWTKDGPIVSQLPTAPARGLPGSNLPNRARPNNGKP